MDEEERESVDNINKMIDGMQDGSVTEVLVISTIDMLRENAVERMVGTLFASIEDDDFSKDARQFAFALLLTSIKYIRSGTIEVINAMTKDGVNINREAGIKLLDDLVPELTVKKEEKDD